MEGTLAGVPEGTVQVPSSIRSIADGRAVRAVWRNGLGGLTFELAGESDRRFVKWGPLDHGPMLEAEAHRLHWASAFTQVPVPLDLGSDVDGVWLLTDALDGLSAVDARWIRHPATAVRAIGEGLRGFHDALPANACPFSWSAESRIASAGRRASLGAIDDGHRILVDVTVPLDEALAVNAQLPPLDALVVCHGDPCAPNTLLDATGRWTAHVDLGSLGVADRWADLAVASWSLEWNYGPGWEPLFFESYGVVPDPERTAYYRLLWDLGP